MELVIDFETRSTVDLKKHGVYVYAADPMTQVICLVLSVDDQAPVVWIADYFREKIDIREIRYEEITEKQVVTLVEKADQIHAQNAAFEYAIWAKKMPGRLPLGKLYDIMAQLAYHALPMNLDQAAQVLNLPHKKDMRGHATMLKLCKPRNPRKAEIEADPKNWQRKTYWHENPSDIETCVNYCGKDVEVARLVKNTLRPLPAQERKIWLLDQKINLRGIGIDTKNVHAIIDTVKSQEGKLLGKFHEIVPKNLVSGPRSYVALKNWVNSQVDGLNIESVGKAETAKLLERKDIPKHVKEVLMIKGELSKSSVAKFSAMIDRAGADGRVRGWSAYHAAATGRWAAWGLQLHNNPRDCYKPERYETVCGLFRSRDIDGLNLLWDNPYYAASRCVRGALVAPEGRRFFCTDFTAVEGVGLAYIAGEDWVLNAYREDVSMYKLAVADLLNIAYDEVTSEQRQIGKVEELFMGYAGGIGAFATGAKTYKIDLESLPAHVMPHATQDELNGQWGAIALAKIYLKKNPGAMSLKAAIACDIIKRKWRAKRPRIVQLWKKLQEAALLAVKNPGRVYSYRRISYCCSGGFLKCRLPSGRVMHYYKPRIKIEQSPDFGESESLTYMGMKIVDGKTTRQWTRIYTHGGKLCENCVQGMCRDLLAESMLRHEAAGYPIVLHCHDEDMAEMPVGTGSLEEFNRIAEIVPEWAKGMPIKTEGWEGKRYQK